ncbi:hypothetical protein, partial [Streptomyces natalensis]|uniref:hypothetical protein n=1 Tax=Streptomyces natalensis TaxID=68242 RepID=UPI0019D70D8D
MTAAAGIAAQVTPGERHLLTGQQLSGPRPTRRLAFRWLCRGGAVRGWLFSLVCCASPALGLFFRRRVGSACLPLRLP